MVDIKSYWRKYKKTFYHVIPYKDQPGLFKISCWRVNLFRNTLMYSFPVGVIVLVPSFINELLAGHLFFPISMTIFMILTMGFVLNRRIKLDYRMAIVVAMLYLLAVLYLVLLGSDGPGALYLLIITFFTAMVFPPKLTYISLLINVLICLSIGLVIQFKPFYTPLADSYDLALWMAYSGNLIFISFISVLMISTILSGFEKTINKEAILVKKLDTSERYYRNIFDSNPVPMYIFELKTGNFLKVNDAAVRKYGYTKDEFLKMNINRIRPRSEIGKLMDLYSSIKTREYSGELMHVNKAGDTFPVEIDTNVVVLDDGVEARLVLATDVSERVNYVRMIEKQNQDFKDIAWVQSHKVRAPLTNIMSLTEMMLQHPHGDQIELLFMLKDSTAKLNETIESIVHQAEDNQITP